MTVIPHSPTSDPRRYYEAAPRKVEARAEWPPVCLYLAARRTDVYSLLSKGGFAGWKVHWTLDHVQNAL
jgi:hypothetical protein